MRGALKSALLRLNSIISRDDGPKIVYYHDLGTKHTQMGTPLGLFCQHMDVHVPCKLTVGFDDGFLGIWDERQCLIAKGIRPVVSLAVDLIGRSGYLGWGQILELQRHGFDFQCHGWTHRSLTDVKDDELGHEIIDSRKALSDRLGKDVSSICFPRGLFSSKVLEVCAKAGYRRAYTCVPGSVGRIRFPVESFGIELIPRNLVQQASSREFQLIANGAMAPLWRRYFNRQFKRS